MLRVVLAKWRFADHTGDVGRFLICVIAVMSLGAASASAANITDLTQLGYTVTISNPGPSDGSCPVYFITGFGVSTYANCHSQDVIDSLANPGAQCNRVWQADHPDQVSAFGALQGKGYGISGDQCADQYTVTLASATVYSGHGAGLPGLVATLAQAPAQSVPGVPTAPGTTCLPLCPTPVPVGPSDSSPTAGQPTEVGGTSTALYLRGGVAVAS